jgi:hypothetical protein
MEVWFTLALQAYQITVGLATASDLNLTKSLVP